MRLESDRMHVFSSALLVVSLFTTQLLAEPKPAETFDFESLEVGTEPEGTMVLDGTVTVGQRDGNKVLLFGPAPLTETALQLGSSARGTQRVHAKVRAEKKRRSAPRFAVGVHGISGYRIRLSPAAGKIELVRNEEVVEAKDFEWESGEVYHMEVSAVQSEDESWKVEARAWKDGTERPAEALFSAAPAKMSGQGKASLYATPFSGSAIEFDDVEVSFE